jgi:hypothetical protein
MTTCTHINRQHTFEGELELLACTLEAGHAGNHFCYMRVVKKPVINRARYRPDELIDRDGVPFLVELEPASWDDSAGDELR